MDMKINALTCIECTYVKNNAFPQALVLNQDEIFSSTHKQGYYNLLRRLFISNWLSLRVLSYCDTYFTANYAFDRGFPQDKSREKTMKSIAISILSVLFYLLSRRQTQRFDHLSTSRNRDDRSTMTRSKCSEWRPLKNSKMLIDHRHDTPLHRVQLGSLLFFLALIRFIRSKNRARSDTLGWRFSISFSPRIGSSR